MYTGLAFIGLLALAIVLFVLRKSKAGRMIWIALIVLPPLAAILFCLCPPKGPMVVFARGHGLDFHLFESVSEYQMRGWFSSLFNIQEPDTNYAPSDEQYVNANWDGKYLYVDGWCGVCGKPYAPPGTFVLAILPKGFAYTRHLAHPRYHHMSRPVYITRWEVLEMVLPYVLSFSLFLVVAGWIGRKIKSAAERLLTVPQGCCIKCGYNLTGNESGVCPECGCEV